MPTRQVTGSIVRPDGSPWSGFKVEFRLTPTAYTLDAAFPEDVVSTATIADGSFEKELVTGVTYIVSYPDIFIRNGSSTQYPKMSSFPIVVPDGDGPITLGELQTAGNLPTANPSAITLINAAVDPVAAAVEALAGNVTALTEQRFGDVPLVIDAGEDFALAILYVNVDGSAFDVTGYSGTFRLWANGGAGGTPLLTLTEGDGMTTEPGTLDGDPYTVLVEIDAATIDALPDIGVGSYALTLSNGVDYPPLTVAASTIVVDA